MASSTIPLLLLVLGIITGSFIKFSSAGIVVSLLLYFLILLVGIILGEGEMRLRIGDLRIPVLTLAGTLLSGVMVSPITGLPVNVSVAISAGLGWYTLAGPLVTKICGVKAGAMALLSNLFREMISLTFARTISERAGCDSLAASAGAASMDTMLPFIAQVCDRSWTMRSFVSGLVLTLLVPLLIPLLLGL